MGKKLLHARMSRLLFFQHCGTGFLESLLPKVKVTHFVKGAEIVKGGEPADSMLIVVSGSVKFGNARDHKTGRKNGSLLSSLTSRSMKSEDGDAQVNESVDDLSHSESSIESLDIGEFLPKGDAGRGKLKEATAGPEGICIGEGIILGYQNMHTRRASAV